MLPLFFHEAKRLESSVEFVQAALARAKTDQFLRSQGWEIYSRPREGEPRWKHPAFGLLTQSDALIAEGFEGSLE